MTWLLDTNVVSDSVRDRPDPAVSRWIAEIPRAEAAISIVTLAELWDGAASVSDEARRRRLMNWVENEVTPIFEQRTLPLTRDVLAAWLRLSRKLRVRQITRDPSDMLIASTALSHNLTLVTRNVRDFANTGILVYDPWHDETHKMEQP